MVRRPVCWFASADVGTVAFANSREKSAYFGRDKTRAQSGVLRVSVASDQKPRTQGMEKSSVGGRRGVARRTVDDTPLEVMEGLQGGQQ
jgi:hypothetical protein